jgi:hypothetical protein
MAKYKLQDNGVLDTETGASIPEASGNRHWQEYQEWVAQGNVADPKETLNEVKTRRMAEIKDAAASHIVSNYPEWKQRNMLARMAEIQDKQLSGTPLTTSEEEEISNMRASWTWVNAVRTESDVAEAAISAASTIEECEAVTWNFPA